MSDWLHGLPVLWMAILVFGFTYLVTAGIYAVITVFAVGERARSFKAISPGLLSPLGVIFTHQPRHGALAWCPPPKPTLSVMLA